MRPGVHCVWAINTYWLELILPKAITFSCDNSCITCTTICDGVFIPGAFMGGAGRKKRDAQSAASFLGGSSGEF